MIIARNFVDTSRIGFHGCNCGRRQSAPKMRTANQKHRGIRPEMKGLLRASTASDGDARPWTPNAGTRHWVLCTEYSALSTLHSLLNYPLRAIALPSRIRRDLETKRHEFRKSFQISTIVPDLAQSGARRGELCRAQISDVDWTKRTITLAEAQDGT
jgi:hypothetical protein